MRLFGFLMLFSGIFLTACDGIFIDFFNALAYDICGLLCGCSIVEDPGATPNGGNSTNPKPPELASSTTELPIPNSPRLNKTNQPDSADQNFQNSAQNDKNVILGSLQEFSSNISKKIGELENRVDLRLNAISNNITNATGRLSNLENNLNEDRKTAVSTILQDLNKRLEKLETNSTSPVPVAPSSSSVSPKS
ncbi:hypothetical protein QAD02_023788 [Eretmocerus hayati]|uniref:Uncharacterized protein n=1 Tax=Eretmocerus hayati TaxID=131215 RepID=A0ACC2PXY4_9HYME|nr:hypothetical protein QAD02_023788 [Eretmocerus hayati]